MSRAVLYVAHCLRPSEEEIAAQQPTAHVYSPHRPSMGSEMKIPLDAEMRKLAIRAGIEANLKRAMRWLSWLRRSFPETTFIAPWIASVLAGDDDGNPAHREAGIADALAVIERCDGIVLCGPRISEGMRREMEHGQERHTGDRFTVYNLTPTTARTPSRCRTRTAGYCEPSQIPADLTPNPGQTLFSWIHRMVGYRLAQESSP